MRLYACLFLTLLLFLTLVSAATLKGSVYNSHLDLEKEVLVTINTLPEQKMLVKDGTYSFVVPAGSYSLTVQGPEYSFSENVEVISDGEYVRDLFLIPGLGESGDLWSEENVTVVDENILEEQSEWYWWVIISVVFVVLILMVVYLLKKNYAHEKVEVKNSEQPKEELSAEPGYVEEALEIIKKHGGRIYQTELRREMMHLSESKISLILTELEYKGKIEKIKKGRGNAIILK
jgi:uncharacterized membrane protein